MKTKKSTAQFVEEAKRVFGEKYDYSATEFVGSHYKVRVICPDHGEFEQTARELLKGRGCPHCSGRKPVTTERFVVAGRTAYGDKYNYDKAVCHSVRDKVCVTCPEHGDWWPTALNHMRGKAGCPVCAGNQLVGLAAFIARSTAIHDGKYSYVNVKDYAGSKEYVEILCPEHGPFLQTSMAHLAGQGCPKCAGKGTVTTETFIALSREIHGDAFDYSKTVFKTTQDKLTLICKKAGHEFKQWYGTHIYQKSGCPVCAGNAFKTTEQFIEDARKVHGDKYDYSLVEYTGKARKVRIICKSHGVFEQTPNAHLSGAGCAACYEESKPLTQEEFIVRARAIHGGKYSYDKVGYTKASEKVIITCPEHGDWEVIAGAHIYRKTGCQACSGTRQFTTETFIAKAREKHGDTYEYDRTVYNNYDEKMTITCKKHGDFQQSADSHLQGKGCSLCANVGPSKAQREIMDFIGAYTPAVEEHRFPGSRRRFDIFLPEKNIAIEYNGLYWHNSRREAIDREKEKHDVALKHGVRVITVFEDEWNFQTDIVQRSLLSAIGELPRVFARNCVVTGLSNEDVGHFYLENHIQGSPRSPVHYGLFHNGALVACMSFGMLRSSRRNTDKRHWELTRYASTCTVVGGASKLLNAFKALGAADKLTSYSDARMFSGAMYEKLGFTRTHQTPPDYYYVNTRVASWRVHKAKFQKKHLVNLFPGCDVENKTEKEICEENGYYQVYDCGKVRWDLDLI